MIDNTKSLHDEKVASLIKKYRDQGFTVIQNPKADQLPFDLDNYQPDILATKNENETGLIGLIIEVKTSISPVSVERLQSVAEKISRHPGWRFLLVTLEDIEAESLPGTSEELPSWEELINYFSQVSKLIENNNIEPAFLFLWSVFEGALRKRAVDVSISVERLPVIRLLRSMYSLGELSISEFDSIQACLEQRNRLAHGYIQKLDLEVLHTFVILVVKLLIEWTSNISETEKIAVLQVSRQIMVSMTENIKKATAQRNQKFQEIVVSELHNHPKEKEILAKIKHAVEKEEGGNNFFNELQHLSDEYYDTSTESKNQQPNKNEIVLDDNAQIAFDTLPTQEKEKISYAISCLENFPGCSEIEFSHLNSSPDNDFIAKVGIYRIIFEVQPEKVTIIDIVNYKRIEMLYGLLEKAKV
jgi:mRNA-degrading endonuclease RelE of RelBE toxin-antitoxin system/Holliday junction resolvase